MLGGGGGGARGEGSECFSHCFSPLVPHPIVFCFELGSAFARLYLLLHEQPGEKNTPKKPQARQVIFLPHYKPNIFGPSSGCVWISRAHGDKKNLRGRQTILRPRQLLLILEYG